MATQGDDACHARANAPPSAAGESHDRRAQRPLGRRLRRQDRNRGELVSRKRRRRRSTCFAFTSARRRARRSSTSAAARRGSSTHLLARRYADVTVLDLSATALAAAQARLGEAAQRAAWIAADVTAWRLPSRAYDVWHDRAAFPLPRRSRRSGRLSPAAAASAAPRRRRDRRRLGLDGPERCSGLPVKRYGTPPASPRSSVPISPSSTRDGMGASPRRPRAAFPVRGVPLHRRRRSRNNRGSTDEFARRRPSSHAVAARHRRGSGYGDAGEQGDLRPQRPPHRTQRRGVGGEGGVGFANCRRHAR